MYTAVHYWLYIYPLAAKVLKIVLIGCLITLATHIY